MNIGSKIQIKHFESHPPDFNGGAIIIPFGATSTAIIQKPFKKYMGPQLRMKHTPDLKFYFDDTFEYTEHVSKLMNKLDIRDN